MVFKLGTTFEVKQSGTEIFLHIWFVAIFVYQISKLFSEAHMLSIGGLRDGVLDAVSGKTCIQLSIDCFLL